jgi:hypothetical protein
MQDRITSRGDKLRQQIISQKEVKKGERKMTEPTNNQAPEGSMDDDQLDAELREAIQAKLLREQEEAGEDMGDVSSISEAHSQHSDEEDEVEPEEEERAPTVSELFAGENAVRMRISPRIMLNVAAQPVSDVPDVVRIGESFYSVASPLRKSKGKKIGSKSNPHGLIRDSLGELASFIGHMQDSDVMLFGDTNDLEARVNDLVNYLDGEARNIMYGVFEEFADENTPLFSFRVAAPVEDEADEDLEDADEDSLDNIGVTEVDATSSVPPTEYRQAADSFVVNSWPVLEIAEDGTLILRPTISININVPLLVAASDIVKPLASMSKIVANYAREAGLEEDDFRVTFAFDSANLLDGDLLNLLQTHAAEDSDSVIISGAYLEQCVADQAHDVYRLFPTGRSVAEARNLLLSNGGDTLLLL